MYSRRHHHHVHIRKAPTARQRPPSKGLFTYILVRNCPHIFYIIIISPMLPLFPVFSSTYRFSATSGQYFQMKYISSRYRWWALPHLRFELWGFQSMVIELWGLARNSRGMWQTLYLHRYYSCIIYQVVSMFDFWNGNWLAYYKSR